MTFRLRECSAGLAVAVLAVAAAASPIGSAAHAQSEQLAVKWDDPEIKRFERRGRTRSLRAATSFDQRIEKLKLPVLGYERPIPKVRSAFRSAAPKAVRTLTMDEANPIWYEISYDYGNDIKITVDADLRVQSKLAPGAKVYDSDDGKRPETEISVFDERSEVGMIGAIAEFKVYKFGQVPYTVTIECSERKKDVCRDVEGLKRDKRFLKLIAVPSRR